MKNSGCSMKWKKQAVNRMLLALITKLANTFFMIVQQKALKAEEVSVMTRKLLNQEKSTNRQTAPLNWLLVG